MSLPKGASLAHGEKERIEKALESLEKDFHAPSEMLVKINIQVFQEYPKHIQIGDKSVVVNSAAEEKALK